MRFEWVKATDDLAVVWTMFWLGVRYEMLVYQTPGSIRQLHPKPMTGGLITHLDLLPRKLPYPGLVLAYRVGRPPVLRHPARQDLRQGLRVPQRGVRAGASCGGHGVHGVPEERDSPIGLPLH